MNQTETKKQHEERNEGIAIIRDQEEKLESRDRGALR